MGRRMRIELMHTGATNQRVNHFTNAAIKDKYILSETLAQMQAFYENIFRKKISTSA